MGLLDFFRSKPEKRFHPGSVASSSAWFSKSSKSGVEVTRERAMESTPVYAAITLLADSISSCPLVVYEAKTDDRGRRINERATRHSLYRLLHTRPNRWQNRQQYFELVVGHLLINGNHFAKKVLNERGEVVELHPMLPHLVDIQVTSDLDFLYHYKISASETLTFRRHEVLHISGFGYDGVRGYSPIHLHREAIGLGLAAEEFAARSFSSFGRPGGIITHPGPLEPEDREIIKDSWQEAHSGLENAHRVALFEGEIKWQATSFSNEDLEFIESRRFSLTEVARIFRIPPPLLQDLERATFSNVQELGNFFRDFTLRPLAVRIEEALKSDLVPAKQQGNLYPKFKLEALFRANIDTRYSAYGEAIRDGWISRNEVRLAEDMNPVDGLDEHLLPLNMVEESSAQDVSDDDNDFTEEDDRATSFGPLFKDTLQRYKTLESQRIQKAQKRGLCPNETRTECLSRLREMLTPVSQAFGGFDVDAFITGYNEDDSIDELIQQIESLAK